MNKIIRDGIVIGSIASVLSGIALALAGLRENNAAAAPTNAVSHWLWRGRAFTKDDVSIKYTLVGYVIHHAMSIFWGTIHAAIRRPSEKAESPAKLLADGVITAAAACTVDYTITPKRLTPGFEHRLSKPALVGVYAAFGVGVAIACWILSEKK